MLSGIKNSIFIDNLPMVEEEPTEPEYNYIYKEKPKKD